nr:YihY/virulence factor BrkB family protein [Williamsia sterculiae]
MRLPVWSNLHRLVWRTAVKAWQDSIVAMSAQAAFWQTLSLAPLLLGLLSSIGYVAGWFGPDTIDIVHARIIGFASRTFSENVVDEIIKPTVADVLGRGRVEFISIGFVMSLWAGSSAMSNFIDSISRAHEQNSLRNPVWQRIFALNVYLAFLVGAVFILPLVALGPTYINELLPDSWNPIGNHLIAYGYYPAVGLLLVLGLATMYHVALPRPLPWHRLIAGALLAAVVFAVASWILRIYLAYVVKAGYSYGALATPIAFLLFTFFLGFAIVIGAEFNATVQRMWPAKPSHIDVVRDWVSAQADDITGQLRGIPERLQTGPIRRRGHPAADARSTEMPMQSGDITEVARDGHQQRSRSPLRR